MRAEAAGTPLLLLLAEFLNSIHQMGRMAEMDADGD